MCRNPGTSISDCALNWSLRCNLRGNKQGVTSRDASQLCLVFLQARVELETWDMHCLSLPWRREARCEGEIGREESEGRGDDEGLWQYFWELRLTLKVMFPFDIFSISCAVTLARHEQSTSGISSLWGCVLTTSVQAIFWIYHQCQFTRKIVFLQLPHTHTLFLLMHCGVARKQGQAFNSLFLSSVQENFVSMNSHKDFYAISC